MIPNLQGERFPHTGYATATTLICIKKINTEPKKANSVQTTITFLPALCYLEITLPSANQNREIFSSILLALLYMPYYVV